MLLGGLFHQGDGGREMTIVDITLAVLTLRNILRTLACIPQIVRMTWERGASQTTFR